MSGIDPKTHNSTLYILDNPQPGFSDKPFHDHLPVMLPKADIEQDMVALFETLTEQDKNEDGLSFIELARYVIDLKTEKKVLEEDIEDISTRIQSMTGEERYMASINHLPLSESTERLNDIEKQLGQINYFISGSSSEASITDLLSFVRKNDSNDDRKLSQDELFYGLSENLDNDSADQEYWPQSLGYIETSSESLMPVFKAPINVPLPKHSVYGSLDETYPTEPSEDAFTHYPKP